MIIRVRLFAGMRQELETDFVELDLPADSTIADVRAQLIRQFERLAPLLSRVRFAVDEAYVVEDATITENSSVACIPPVSGG